MSDMLAPGPANSLEANCSFLSNISFMFDWLWEQLYTTLYCTRAIFPKIAVHQELIFRWNALVRAYGCRLVNSAIHKYVQTADHEGSSCFANC